MRQPASPQALLQLQSTMGNRAVGQMLAAHQVQAKLNVGPANDKYEQEADQVATRVMGGPAPASSRPAEPSSAGGAPAVQTSPARSAASSGGFAAGSAIESRVAGSQGAGLALPGGTLSFMEAKFGANFGGVRLHTDDEALQMNRALQSEAFTHGNDIYVGAGGFDPQSNSGKHLLAHELTHVVQQGGASDSGAPVQRKPAVTVQNRLPANRLSTKRMKVYLDFVRMKRQPAQFGKIIARTLGLSKRAENKGGDQSGGTFGHWWTELGDLDGDGKSGKWTPLESFGWWPGPSVGIKQTFAGVEGQLNRGNQDDPHHGEDVGANQMFHPVMDVEMPADYKQVRDQVTSQIRSFATSFKGKWMWRFGWGKNCHTFQEKMMRASNLKDQKGKAWLKRPDDADTLAATIGKEREAQAQEAFNKKHPGVDYTLDSDMPAKSSGGSVPDIPAGAVIRLLNDQMHLSEGQTLSDIQGWMEVQFVYDKKFYTTYFDDITKNGTRA